LALRDQREASRLAGGETVEVPKDMTEVTVARTEDSGEGPEVVVIRKAAGPEAKAAEKAAEEPKAEQPKAEDSDEGSKEDK
jgi:hypothetical protein